MSRSRKDGRHGGAHRNTQGREYWSSRGMPMMEPGRESKRLTHRMERNEARVIERAALAGEVES